MGLAKKKDEEVQRALLKQHPENLLADFIDKPVLVINVASR